MVPSSAMFCGARLLFILRVAKRRCSVPAAAKAPVSQELPVISMLIFYRKRAPIDVLLSGSNTTFLRVEFGMGSRTVGEPHLSATGDGNSFQPVSERDQAWEFGAACSSSPLGLWAPISMRTFNFFCLLAIVGAFSAAPAQSR